MPYKDPARRRAHDAERRAERNAYQREYQKKNGQRLYQAVKARGIARRERLIALKGGRCERGPEGCEGSLEFHHRNPATKSFELTTYDCRQRWDLVIEEVAKCDLLCQRHHREADRMIGSLGATRIRGMDRPPKGSRYAYRPPSEIPIERKDMRAIRQAWYAQNRERIRENQRAYQAANREQRNAYKREWRAANIERVREQQREWKRKKRAQLRTVQPELLCQPT